MKKKLITAVATMAMLFTMGTNAFAATTSISFPASNVKGDLSSVEDTDKFTFVTPTGTARAITYKLEGPSDQTYKISVYRTSDNKPLGSVIQGVKGYVKLEANTAYYLYVSAFSAADYDEDSDSHDYYITATLN
ncbi:hypothetical protein [Paenibacillus mucilaginosus]|uniref:Uncharacterized protein n=1 Tax=Paenibacillus mucilaginosus (strain KNP414) TaxID=1036673 RepID=F8FEP6_PAEMK|nr:hypothetical protein [Paenibacillus mucilaginosus]AEI45363.1 hypothetical protein KNP414_06844 [Paenibacillus mucilaginosus KNP414]MCG7218072.1 hypothetical protein [Paenibacillus mucilaginosus]WDM26813.1 hypothetical protein KCX80_31080 [Paenibacillus mucilaginosus]